MVSKVYLKGDKYTLKCGTEVEIVEAKSAKEVIITDGTGKTKKVKGDELKRGEVRWIKEHKQYKNGAKIHLSCGVDVEVIEYTNGRIILSDCLGNKKDVLPSNLWADTVLWPWPVDGNIKFKCHVGDIFKLKNGITVEVIDYGKSPSLFSVRDTSDGEVKHNINYRYLKNGTLTWRKSTLPKGYYVYIASENSNVCYVGSGKSARYKHVTSGTSHNYELNKHHFSDAEELDVIIFKDGLTQKESLLLEQEMIDRLKPKYNHRPVYY